MFRRLLLNPAPAEGGGAPSAPAPSPAPQPSATPPAAPPTPGAQITVSPDQYRAFLEAQNQLATLQAQQQAAIDAANAKAAQALIEKGEVEKGLERLRADSESKLQAEAERFRKLQGEYHGKVRNEALNGALAEFRSRLQDGAEAVLMQLWANDFEVAPDHAGNLVVRDRTTFRPAADVVKERLADARFGMFFKPSTQGGAGAVANAAGTVPTPTGQPQPQGVFAQFPGMAQQVQQIQQTGHKPAFGLRAARPRIA